MVLDGSSGLKVDALTDAAGSETMPMGGVNTGFGGTAPRQPSDPAPWLLLIAAGTLLAVAGLARPGPVTPRRGGVKQAPPAWA